MQFAGDVKFSNRWIAFGPMDRETPPPPKDVLESVPNELEAGADRFKPRRLTPTRNQFDFSSLLDEPRHSFGQTFLVFIPLQANEAGEATLGLGGDFRLRAWLNGDPLFGGEEIQDRAYPPAIANIAAKAALRKGQNMLAVRFVLGRGSGVMTAGGPREWKAGDFRSIVTDVYINEPAWSHPRPKPRGDKDCVDIGDRRELFIDDFLVDRLSGGAERRMHHPVHREIVMEMNMPWEGNVKSNYFPTTVMRVDGRIRLYYKGVEMKGDEPPHTVHLGSDKIKTEHVCVAESEDGVHFTRPRFGNYAFRGSRENNIVLRRGRSAHNFAPFLDENPDALADQRFKALSYAPKGGFGGGLTAHVSRDGIRWKLASEKPLITKGAFDSQNTAFWDAARGRYVEYHRGQPKGEPRGIMTSESKDFLHWSEPQSVDYEDDRREHMYINCIRPYFRAPHILVGTPARLVPARVKVPTHPNAGVSDAVLMCSRDGHRFHRWADGFIRPGAEDEVWTDRNSYPSWGMVRTSPTELSLYWCEHNGHPGLRLRRGTLRVDGFVSIHSSGEEVGEMLTRPFRFSGTSLEVNYATSANGALLFELCEESGKPLPGFTFADSEVLFGNEVAHTVVWRGHSTDTSSLEGLPVRLRVRLRDGDLYAIRFPLCESPR